MNKDLEEKIKLECNMMVSCSNPISTNYHTKAILNMVNELQEERNWLLVTLQWMSDPESNGGISTCEKHNGHGFKSDCAICNYMEEMSK